MAKSASRSNNCCSPCRTIGWSSARMSRMDTEERGVTVQLRAAIVEYAERLIFQQDLRVRHISREAGNHRTAVDCPLMVIPPALFTPDSPTATVPRRGANGGRGT